MTLYDMTSQALRFKQVVSICMKHGLYQIFSYLHPKNSKVYRWITDTPPYASLGRRARLALEELGPTFIKLGQLLSTRYDIFPAEVIAELEKLQDSVKPLPFREIKRQIERSTKKRLKELFSWFDPIPLATASIAQVHQARLRTGELVAVKVRKPNIERQVQQDLDIMMHAATILEKRFTPEAVLRPTSVVKEFRSAVLSEINFLNEMKNLQAFAINFATKNDEVVIPRVYMSLCTREMLVLEYLDGIRITSMSGDKKRRQLVARRSFLAILKMLFDDGLYHADPHPSNVFVLKDSRIAFLDFGLVGRLDDRIKTRFLRLVMAAYQKDYVTVADIFYSMGEEIGLKPDRVSRDAMLADLKEYLYKYADLTAKEFSVFAALREFLVRSRKHHVFIPEEYTLVFKTLFTIEGVGTHLDPDFDLNGTILEFAAGYFARYPQMLAS
jgi:ubiquinone biosynthesis protein